MGFKCLLFGYDVSERACRECKLKEECERKSGEY